MTMACRIAAALLPLGMTCAAGAQDLGTASSAPVAPEATTVVEDGPFFLFAGTQTAPSRKQTNIDSNSWLLLRAWTSTRSPLVTPRAASAAAIASTRASSSAQVQCRAPQASPIASGNRRAALRRKWARFITRREHGATPPRGAPAATIR